MNNRGGARFLDVPHVSFHLEGTPFDFLASDSFSQRRGRDWPVGRFGKPGGAGGRRGVRHAGLCPPSCSLLVQGARGGDPGARLCGVGLRCKETQPPGPKGSLPTYLWAPDRLPCLSVLTTSLTAMREGGTVMFSPAHLRGPP